VTFPAYGDYVRGKKTQKENKNKQTKRKQTNKKK
jgi:hypothetical protein